MSELHQLVARCLNDPTDTPQQADLLTWRTHWLAWVDQAFTSGDRPTNVSATLAAYAGFRADRVAWAFLAGYQSAILSMFDDHPSTLIGSFSVTETHGNRPRDMTTHITARDNDRLQLDGAKSWVAAGADCDVLLVAAQDHRNASDLSTGDRPIIRMLRVPANTAGISFVEGRPQSVVPELIHSGVTFEGVTLPASCLVPGDGYAGYVKPFRTAEDIHIAIAMLAYLLRCARQLEWPAEFIERNVGLFCALGGAASMPPGSAVTHVVLGDLLRELGGVYEHADRCFASSAGGAAVDRWQRDRPLFQMASRVRGQRLARAWETIAANR